MKLCVCLNVLEQKAWNNAIYSKKKKHRTLERHK